MGGPWNPRHPTAVANRQRRCEYLSLYRSGQTQGEIARELGVTRQAVSLVLRKAGIETREIEERRKRVEQRELELRQLETPEFWRTHYREQLKRAGLARCVWCAEWDWPEKAAKDGLRMTPHRHRDNRYSHRSCNAEYTRWRYAKSAGKEFIPRDQFCACGKPAAHMGTCPFKGRWAGKANGANTLKTRILELERKGYSAGEIAQRIATSTQYVYNVCSENRRQT